MSEDELNKRFKYHPAFGMQPGLYGAIRSKMLECATLVQSLCPESREASMSITKLEEAMFWANASIARNYAETAEETVQNGTTLSKVS